MEHFAYPNGSYNDTLVDIVRRTGFRSAVTTEQRLWQRHDGVCEIPRVAVGRYDSIEQFKLNVVGGIRELLPWHRSPKPPRTASSTCTP